MTPGVADESGLPGVREGDLAELCTAAGLRGVMFFHVYLDRRIVRVRRLRADLRRIPGAHVDLGLAIVIYAGTTIAGALSFLPGGLGVTEGAMTLALVDGAAHARPRDGASPRRC